VTAVVNIVRQLGELLLWPIDRMPELLGLTVISVVTGALLLWLVGKTTPQRWVERARNQMTSAIYEIRLYLDSPLRVLCAQGRLLCWSGVYLGVMIPALAVGALPLGLLYLHLDTRYGLEPLPVGQPALVRLQLAEGIDGNEVHVQPPSGLRVEKPSLYLEAERSVYFEMIPSEPRSQELSIQVGDHIVSKRIAVAGGPERPAPERRSGVAALWQLGDEPALATGGPVQELLVAHPPHVRHWLGLPWWWGYWLLIATLTALLLRRRLDVAI
jgi:hypothetical protein